MNRQVAGWAGYVVCLAGYVVVPADNKDHLSGNKKDDKPEEEKNYLMLS